MYIYFSHPNELLLAAPAAELHRLQRLVETATEHDFPAGIPADVSPYGTHLDVLAIRVSEGPVLVSVHGSELRIAGGPETLAPLGSFFAAAVGSHTHYEWYPGNEWIDAQSIPLVIGCTDRS